MRNRGTPLQLVQISDLHLATRPGALPSGEDPDASLAAVLAAVRAEDPGPDLVLATGDLSEDGSPDAYRRLQGELERLPCPVYCLPGNHDAKEAMKAHLVGGSVRMQRAVTRGPWQIVFLDTAVEGVEYGLLQPVELEALEDLLRAESAEHVFIALHHGPDPPCRTRYCGLDNGAELLDLLGRYRGVRGVVWGHIHETIDRTHDGIRLLSCPSTCVHIEHRPAPPGFEPQAFTDLHRFDASRRGYRRLRLWPDGAVDTEAVWL